VAIGLGTDLDDPSAFQLPQPLGELAADEDVAKDDHGPALGQEL